MVQCLSQPLVEHRRETAGRLQRAAGRDQMSEVRKQNREEMLEVRGALRLRLEATPAVFCIPNLLS